MSETTKFFSVVEPKQSDRPGARQFVVGDEWHDGEGVRVWDGEQWALTFAASDEVLNPPAGFRYATEDELKTLERFDGVCAGHPIIKLEEKAGE